MLFAKGCAETTAMQRLISLVGDLVVLPADQPS